MRKLEKQSGGTYKVKKYETLIDQIWHLLPLVCRKNCPNMFQSLTKVLNRLEQYLNTDEFGLRGVALKTFSALIDHCRNTKVVDA